MAALAVALVYVPTWGVILPLVLVALLLAPETRAHLRPSLVPHERSP